MTAELLADYRPFHSAFQIDHFIVGRAGTPWGRYQQALREIATREDAQADERIDLAEVELGLEHPELSIEEDPGGRTLGIYHEARLRIHVGRLEARRERLRRSIADRQREIARFTALATALRAELGELTEERKATLERETWLWRLLFKAATDLIACGGLTTETVDLMIALPADLRETALAEIENRDRLKAWAGAGAPPLQALPETAG